MPKQNISATIDSRLLSRIDDLSEETERNRSWLIGKAIETYLEELEDLKVAKSRLDDKRLNATALKKAIGV